MTTVVAFAQKYIRRQFERQKRGSRTSSSSSWLLIGIFLWLAGCIPELRAVRLHHRVVAIHPWPNGNERHSRLIADVLIASRVGEELTWGARSDLVNVSEVRDRYLAAIRAADAGDITLLLNFARS